MYGCEWELNYKESWALENWCFWTVMLEKTFESPLHCKIKPVNRKGNQSWIFIGRTDAEAETPILWPPHAKSLTHWKRPWRWERLKVEVDDRGWDGWMASPTRWTWVWAGSGSWWWTGNPGVLQSMGSQSVRHDWATELNFFVEPPVAYGDVFMLQQGKCDLSSCLRLLEKRMVFLLRVLFLLCAQTVSL